MARPAPTLGQLYLSVREVASRTSVAPRTVTRWIAAGLSRRHACHLPRALGNSGYGRLTLKYSWQEAVCNSAIVILCR